MPQLDDWTDLVQPLRAGLAALLVSSGPLLALTFVFGWQDVAEAVGAGRVRGNGPGRALARALADRRSRARGAAREDEGDEPGSPERAAGEGGTAGRGGDPRARRARRLEPSAAGTAVPGWALAAFALATLWKLVYSPIALVAAAISRSFVATLNPLAGLDAIRRMGATYWSAMGVLHRDRAGRGPAGLGLSRVPVAGRLLSAFVEPYSFLAIGCLLGLAVFKKAPELGLN